MNTYNLIDAHSGVLFSHKENEVHIHATTGMNLENGMLYEGRQLQKDT